MTHGLAGVFARKVVEVELVVEAHPPFWLMFLLGGQT